jgi:hypothetical protein
MLMLRNVKDIGYKVVFECEIMISS